MKPVSDKIMQSGETIPVLFSAAAEAVVQILTIPPRWGADNRAPDDNDKNMSMNP